MRLSAILLLFLFSTSYSADMLADIQTPVHTPFGLYTPHLVDVTPNVPTCFPGDNLENVINLLDYDFSPAALELLKKNHFVVTPAVQSDKTGFNEMFDMYNQCREAGIPQFITTDAILHGFHLLFDHILLTCETKNFLTKLDTLLLATASQTEQQAQAATEKSVQKALALNSQYLEVALRLLHGDTRMTQPPDPVNDEIALIMEAQAQLAPSPIFGYPEDYTQYKPRGHYTKTTELERYFRAMMWLGRMTFSCENNSQYSLDMTLSAVLLTQALSQVDINGHPGLDVWENIYQPTIFFVGKSDDINFPQYLPICYDVYGKSFPIYAPDTFAEKNKLNAFLKETEQFSPAQITYPGQPLKGFRFMGQRFIPDSWILDELVFAKIPDRLMPTGLDVMLVLGHEKQAQNEWAFQHLSDRDKNDASYVAKLDTLKAIFHTYPDEVWAQNMYWNWLYCFMPLLMPKGDGYPFFMQTNAWHDKDLYAALASWAELRHDTILYAKQSGTDTGMSPVLAADQGYVEPNPHFYARMTALADFMIQGLSSRLLLYDEFKRSLTLFAELSEQLLQISEKELNGDRLSIHDEQTIFEFGRTLYDIVTFKQYTSDGLLPFDVDGLDPMPVIADVHYEPNSGSVLEEAVGYPYAIYVICTIEGRPTITKGAGFSYYEFTQPATNRLTDEQWREMLDTGTNPPSPSWSQSFIVDANIETPSRSYFEWHKFESWLARHTIPNIVEKGHPLNFTLTSFFESETNAPHVICFLADGRQQILNAQWNGDIYGWNVSAETTDWPLGVTYIEIENTLGQEHLFYRTHFEIKNGSAVSSAGATPRQWALYQNYPNPFNPQTMIKIETAKATFIELNVYDIRGRKVRTLVSSTQPAGIYFVPWDGTDDDGNRLTSGIYYYQIRAGDSSDVKRMVLLR